MSDAVIVALIAGVPVILTSIGGFIVMLRRVKEVKEVATETRDMADGRLTAVTEQLGESEATVARLVNEGVSSASQSLLAKADAAAASMLANADARAADLLARAEAKAVELLAGAERKGQRRHD